jgi:hypothetical protein
MVVSVVWFVLALLLAGSCREAAAESDLPLCEGPLVATTGKSSVAVNYDIAAQALRVIDETDLVSFSVLLSASSTLPSTLPPPPHPHLIRLLSHLRGLQGRARAERSLSFFFIFPCRRMAHISVDFGLFSSFCTCLFAGDVQRTSLSSCADSLSHFHTVTRAIAHTTQIPSHSHTHAHSLTRALTFRCKRSAGCHGRSQTQRDRSEPCECGAGQQLVCGRRARRGHRGRRAALHVQRY